MFNENGVTTLRNEKGVGGGGEEGRGAEWFLTECQLIKITEFRHTFSELGLWLKTCALNTKNWPNRKGIIASWGHDWCTKGSPIYDVRQIWRYRESPALPLCQTKLLWPLFTARFEIKLNSKEFCNSYIFLTPREEPLITLK